MRRLSLFIVLSIGLVLSACGNSSDSGSGTTTTAPTSTTTTVPPASQDQAKAKAIVLTQAEVGAGFKPAVDEPEEQTPDADKAFRECSQNNPVLNSESEERSAESEFDKDDFVSVASNAEFWTNEAEFKAAFDILASDAFVTCLNGAFDKLFAALTATEGAVISNLKTVKKTVTAAGADQTAGITTSLTIAAGNVRVPLFLDMTFMRKGRAGVMLMTSSAQRVYSASETERLTAILTQRLVANAG